MGRHNPAYRSPRRTSARWRRHHPPSPTLAEFIAGFERDHPEVAAQLRAMAKEPFIFTPIPDIEPLPWPGFDCLPRMPAPKLDPRMFIRVWS